MTVTSGLRAYVLARDGECVIAKLDAGHTCADKWGQWHTGTDPVPLTLGHVREHPGGMRRDEEGWCIAQCARSNEQHDESRLASEVRAYLMGVRAEASMHR